MRTRCSVQSHGSPQRLSEEVHSAGSHSPRAADKPSELPLRPAATLDFLAQCVCVCMS